MTRDVESEAEVLPHGAEAKQADRDKAIALLQECSDRGTPMPQVLIDRIASYLEPDRQKIDVELGEEAYLRAAATLLGIQAKSVKKYFAAAAYEVQQGEINKTKMAEAFGVDRKTISEWRGDSGEDELIAKRRWFIWQVAMEGCRKRMLLPENLTPKTTYRVNLTNMDAEAVFDSGDE